MVKKNIKTSVLKYEYYAAFLEELSAEQIGYAVKFNAFGSNSGTFVKHKNGQLPPNTLSNSTFAGLWFEPSFFNHDDNPNVCWAVMGNLLVARAATKIKGKAEQMVVMLSIHIFSISHFCQNNLKKLKNFCHLIKSKEIGCLQYSFLKR